MGESILVVHDDRHIRLSVRKILEKSGYSIEEAAAARDALLRINSNQFDVILLDIDLPEMSGAGAISVVKEIDSQAAIIALSQTDGDVVTESILKGAYDCVSGPFELDDIECAVERVLAQRRLEFEAHTLRWKLIDRASKKIFGRNASGEQLRDLVENLVHSKSAVLITGEDGTGKEFVAHFIHYKSRRGSSPLIRVNCRMIPEDLLEEDLFGVQKESMDSAERHKPGKLELCHH